MQMFHTFEEWKQEVKDNGCKVRKVTSTKHNTFYQAINPNGRIIGCFNDFKNTDPQNRKPLGQFKADLKEAC